MLVREWRRYQIAWLRKHCIRRCRHSTVLQYRWCRSGKTGGGVGSQRQFDVGSSTIVQACLVAEGNTQIAVDVRMKLRWLGVASIRSNTTVPL